MRYASGQVNDLPLPDLVRGAGDLDEGHAVQDLQEGIMGTW
jgi:hypothetical protein